VIGLHVTTHGCKLNQFDSAELAGALKRSATPVADPAAARLVVVNTCTVTAAADADARQTLRRRRRESPGALIVVTGCYAEREPEALRAMPEVDLVLRRADRPGAAGMILEELRRRFPEELADGCAERVVAEETLPDFGDRTRAFLRVQEGCDLRCSYCVIPRVRGASRSLAPHDVLARFRRLLEAGFAEVVLTGVNTGDYGKDLEPRSGLTSLLRVLAATDGDYRIRLNSVEPRRVTPDLIDLMAAEPRMASHLQIPIQSGSDNVLRAMRRNYRVRHYARTVETLRRRIPDIGLGADVITGFPGETDADFRETAGFLAASPLNYLHVFSYSARPGTAACDLPGSIPAETIRERSLILRELGASLAIAFRRSQQGRRLRALVLGEARADGAWRALTSNFIDVRVAGGPDGGPRSNSFADVIITRVDASGQAFATSAL